MFFLGLIVGVLVGAIGIVALIVFAHSAPNHEPDSPDREPGA